MTTSTDGNHTTAKRPLVIISADDTAPPSAPPGTEVAPPPGSALARSQRLERVRDTARRSKSGRTLHEYARAWRGYLAWCDREGRTALHGDPEVAAVQTAEYLRDRADAGLGRSTIELELAAVALAYTDAGQPSPTTQPGLRRFMRGLRRELGRRVESKAAIAETELRAMLATLPPTRIGIRDRALLLLGFVGAFRRSELVALAVSDVTEDRDGLVVTVRRSKTDQEGSGFVKAIPFGPTHDVCAVRSLRAWLEAANIISGPLFRAVDRHGHVKDGPTQGLTVARVVKRAAEAAGLDPTRFSGHSLRSGFVTSAARAGASERAISNQTGHKSMPVLRAYIRRATVFEDNAATAVVGLIPQAGAARRGP